MGLLKVLIRIISLPYDGTIGAVAPGSSWSEVKKAFTSDNADKSIDKHNKEDDNDLAGKNL